MEVRVSLASDGTYDVPYQTRFEFKGAVKPSSRKTPQVFDRLYQESDIRRRNKIVNSLSSPKFAKPKTLQDPQQTERGDISQSLLRKHAESQARLAKLRAERDYEEAAQMQPAPRINPTSKEILEKAKKLSANLPQPSGSYQPTYQYDSVRSSQERAETDRPHREEAETPSEKRLRIPELKTQGDAHSTVMRLLEQRRKNRKQPSQDSPRSDNLNSLREAVQARSQILEHEEPPPDPLEMDVVDRNDYWLRQKEAKIEAAREKKKESETVGCTFKPNIRSGRTLNSLSSQLSERRLNSTSVSSNRSRSNSRNRSYAELHTMKLNSSYSKTVGQVTSPPASRRVREELQSPRTKPSILKPNRSSSTLSSPRNFTPRQSRPTLTRVVSTPKIQSRPNSNKRQAVPKKEEKRSESPQYNQLSPAKRIYSFSSGFNVRDFIQRAQPMPKYDDSARGSRR